MGTPDFAVPALETLLKSEHEVSLVVTQPDREKGRGKKILKSPVKECAEQYGIPVFQPEKLRTAEATERLAKEHADVYVVAAYGQILSKEILEQPRFGCINIHGSLLPKYRGAAPIQWAVLDGEKESGITIMQMNEGLDTGDIILQERVALDPKETAESLYEKLAKVGGPLTLTVLQQFEDGTVKRIPQEDEKSNYAKMLRREMGEINWNKSAVEIERWIRGMNSWPSAYSRWNGKQLKIWDADVVACAGEKAAPGTVLDVQKTYFDVMTGEGALRVNEVQLEGKKRVPVKDFLLGYKVLPGDQLG